jgi:hypothetical protein
MGIARRLDYYRSARRGINFVGPACRYGLVRGPYRKALQQWFDEPRAKLPTILIRGPLWNAMMAFGLIIFAAYPFAALAHPSIRVLNLTG